MTQVWTYILVPALAAVTRSAVERDLVQRLKARDPQSMARLYDQYGPRVYSVIFRIVRDERAAEDLAQETFIQVWNRIQAFDQEHGAPGAWLLMVARNRAIEYLRSNAATNAESPGGARAVDEPGLFAQLDPTMLEFEKTRQLRRAFEQLPPNEREVLRLAYWEGLSQTAMADRLKQPLDTINRWVRNGLRALREELGQAVVA